MGRVRGICVVVASAVLLGAASADAAPRPARSYDLFGTYDTSIGEGGLSSSQADGGPANAFEDAAVPGAAQPSRPVLRVHAGNRVRHLTADPRRGDWSLSVVFSPSAVAGAHRLVNVSFVPTDSGLYLDNGVLRWRGTASGQRDGTTVLAPDTWHHVVLTRTVAGEVAVYLDGERELAFSDPDGQAAYDGMVDLFRDDGLEHGAGRLVRLRTWLTALSDADARSLDLLDVTAPPVTVRSPVEGTTTSPRPGFSGEGVFDEGSERPDVTVTVLDDAGATVGTLTGGTFAGRFATIWPPLGVAPLLHGRRYTARFTAADRAGNQTTAERRFVVDGAGPAVAFTELPGETSDPTPAFAGPAGTDPGDEPTVTVAVFRRDADGGKRLPPEAETVLSAAGGRFAGEVPVPLAPGDYIVRARQNDGYENQTDAERPLRVVSPAPGAPTSSGAVSAARLRTALLARLRRTTLRRLLRGREAVVFRPDLAGVASVRLTLGRRTLFTARRTVVRAGATRVTLKPARRARAALRRARRARIGVRATFAPTGGVRATRTARSTVRR